MATTTNQRSAIIVTGNEKYPVTPRVRRWLNVMFLDTENIFKTAMLPEFATQQEARDEAMRHYQEQRTELDLIGKGMKPLPEPKHYPLVTIKEPVTIEVVKALFYGPSWLMREIKHCLQQSLDLPALPHSMVTADCGVFQFGVADVTRQEAMKVFNNYRLDSQHPNGLFYSVYIPENLPTGSRANSSTRVRKQALRTVKRANVQLTPAAESIVSRETSEPVTRPANTDEMAILKAAQALLEGSDDTQDSNNVAPIEAIDLGDLTEL